MKWKEFKETLENCITNMFAVIFVIFIIGGFIKVCIDSFKKCEETTTPVEKYEIDSITKENDKLIIKIESLDSIKNAKIIEVKGLDNDSTLKLFYELIRK